MNTRILKINRWNPEPDIVSYAADSLRRGRTVVFPTETVYGLGANGLDAEAVKKIFQAKKRPADNPLILHLSAPEDALRLASVDERARAVMEAFWPGPLTLVLPALPVVPPEVRGGLETVALRMPDHPVALALIGRAGFPVAAPSANRSGRPSPTDASAAIADLDGEVDVVLDAGEVDVGLESTVVDLTEKVPLLLRPGGFFVEKLTDFLGEKLGEARELAARRSPGTRYRHYAPAIPVRIWRGEDLSGQSGLGESGFMGLSAPSAAFAKRILFDTKENYARGVFAGFRAMESWGVRSIVVEWPDDAGIGLALQDRIRRASDCRS